MSTICKIAVPAAAEVVVKAVEKFLRIRNLSFEVTHTEWPLASEHENFYISEDFPSVLSVRQITSDVTEIHFNSFSKVEALASHLSAYSGYDVVVNIYQSVSTASYWALHRGGELIRAVEAGDGVVYAESKKRLNFENDQPDSPFGKEGEDSVFFDYADQDWYNQHVGVVIKVYQEYDRTWQNFVLTKRQRPFGAAAPNQKPWWQFW